MPIGCLLPGQLRGRQRSHNSVSRSAVTKPFCTAVLPVHKQNCTLRLTTPCVLEKAKFPDASLCLAGQSEPLEDSFRTKFGFELVSKYTFLISHSPQLPRNLARELKFSRKLASKKTRLPRFFAHATHQLLTAYAFSEDLIAGPPRPRRGSRQIVQEDQPLLPPGGVIGKNFLSRQRDIRANFAYLQLSNMIKALLVPISRHSCFGEPVRRVDWDPEPSSKASVFPGPTEPIQARNCKTGRSIVFQRFRA